MTNIDLDVDAPEKVADVLRRAADQYRESYNELQTAWQDKDAGRVWLHIARALDQAAAKAQSAVDKHV